MKWEEKKTYISKGSDERGNINIAIVSPSLFAVGGSESNRKRRKETFNRSDRKGSLEERQMTLDYVCMLSNMK